MCCTGLTQELLHLGLDKNNEIRCSNWEQRPLTPAQQAYAATDAYAALKLHQVYPHCFAKDDCHTTQLFLVGS